jgi:mannose/fructose-specific phosphotransferase system component IIA
METAPETMQSRSEGATSVKQDTAGGPAVNNIITLVKENPAMTLAVIAVGMSIVVFLLSWYGEREGRLAQYAAQQVAEENSDLRARLNADDQQLGEIRQRLLFREECHNAR